MKTWICSKCYDIISQTSFYEESNQAKEEKDNLNDNQYTINSFETYANQFKENYFSINSKKDPSTTNTVIDSNQMDIDQAQKENKTIENDMENSQITTSKVTSDSISSLSKKNNSSIVLDKHQHSQSIEKEFWNLMNIQSDLIIKCGEHLISEKYGR